MYFSIRRSDKPRMPVYTTVAGLVCVLILIVNGISLYRNLQTLKGSNALQVQTSRVADRLQYLNVIVMDAETSLRGYFLSGSETYLGPLRAAPDDVEQQLSELDTLLADSPSQQKNLAQLRTLVRRKLALMNQSVAVYKEGGLKEIVKIAEASDGKSVMDEIRLLVVIMVKEQNELLATRAAAFTREYQDAVMGGIGINLGAIVVLGLFYKLVRDSYSKRVEAQRALQDANENLETTVALRTEQLSVLSRHLISMSEVERARLARELHDEMGANLTAISLNLSGVTEKLRRTNPDLAQQLDRARATLNDTVELKRRIIEDLRPSLLDNLGLSAALDAYCKEFSHVSGVACDVLIDGDIDVAGPTPSIAVFRIVQESLNNVAKYAQARNVVVRVAREGGDLAVEISDDGIGIDKDAASKPKSHGLLGMRERALLLGGSLKVERGVNQVGTCVLATIPLGQDGAAAPVGLSAPHPSGGGHILSSPPYSTHPHTLPDLADQGR